MDLIAEANIRRLREMLACEANPSKRDTIRTLLREQLGEARPDHRRRPDGEKKANGPFRSRTLSQERVSAPSGLGGRPFRLLIFRRSNTATAVRRFGSATAAFYFADRQPDLVSAELWQEGESLCELRKIELASGSIWQVGPTQRELADRKGLMVDRADTRIRNPADRAAAGPTGEARNQLPP